MLLTLAYVILSFILFLLSGLFALAQFVFFNNVDLIFQWLISWLIPWGGYINLSALFGMLTVVLKFCITWYSFKYIFWPLAKLGISVLSRGHVQIPSSNTTDLRPTASGSNTLDLRHGPIRSKKNRKFRSI